MKINRNFAFSTDTLPTQRNLAVQSMQSMDFIIPPLAMHKLETKELIKLHRRHRNLNSLNTTKHSLMNRSVD